MRVTNNMMIMNMMRNVNSNLNLMERYQEQLATGKSVTKPHEGPVEVSKVLRYTTERNELEQYASNANDALSWIQSTEGAIKSVNDVLQRARELTVQGANGALATEDRQKIAQELSQLKQELIANANATHAGKFLFSGYQTDRKLFNEDGTYNIDVTQAQVTSANKTVFELGRGESLDVSTNGINIFGHLPLDTITATTVPTEAVAGVPATKEALKVQLDLTEDYSANPVTVTFDGTPYQVDAALLAELKGTTEANITPDLKQELKTEIVSALRSAKNGTDSLNQVADVYFNEMDQLVIKSRTYGNLAGDITFTSTPVPTATELVEGADTTEALIAGMENLLDTDISTAVAEGAGVEKILINLNGEQREIMVDMQALPSNDVAGYVTAMQASVDTAFGTGVITVGGSNANPMTFTTLGTIEGKTPRLSVQPIKAYESELLTDFDDMITALNTGDDAGIQNFLGKLDVQMDNLMAIWGDVGARTNRLELITERINETQVNITSLLSDAEDVDMAEAIMYLKNAENVYRASLSAGARIIQPTLMDFLR